MLVWNGKFGSKTRVSWAREGNLLLKWDFPSWLISTLRICLRTFYCLFSTLLFNDLLLFSEEFDPAHCPECWTKVLNQIISHYWYFPFTYPTLFYLVHSFCIHFVSGSSPGFEVPLIFQQKKLMPLTSWGCWLYRLVLILTLFQVSHIHYPHP